MATLYVGTSQSYQTVADAVAAAAAGDTVIIKGSEYTATDERVTVNKSLTLKAEGDVTMRGLNIGGEDFDFVVDGINFVASEADASGVTGYADNASCISQVGNLRNVTIENCTFDLTKAGMTRTYGIFLSLGTWGFENLTVRNNVCEGYYDEEAYAGYGLIYAANVNNADVSNNTVTYAASHAIQLSLTGKTYQGSGEQTIKIDGNIVDKSYACAVYCADLHNSDMTVEINDNVVSNVQEGSCSIYHGAIRIGQSTISGVEISGNVIDGAQVGIYNAAAIKEGSDGSIVIENNAMSVSQIHPAEDGVTPVVSGLGGTAIPEGTADNNIIVEDAEIPVDSSTDTIYVNNNWSAFPKGTAVVANGKVVVIGTNAFANANDAEAAAEYTASKMVIVEGSDVAYTKDQYYFLNTNPNEGGENNAFDYVVDADKTYDMQVDGTFKAYQVLLNNADTDVSATGKLIASGEALRVMGGTFDVQGVRAEGAADPDQSQNEIFTGSWGGGTHPGSAVQIKAGYFTVNQKAVANINDTVMFVNAGSFNVDDATANFDNTYIYLGSGGTYADIAFKVANGATLTLANNSTVINDKEFGMNVTVDATSTFTMDASSSITATTLTVADGGKFIINAANFSGYKKVVDLAGTESLEGKVTIEGKADDVRVIYGSDGDVTLTDADMTLLYVNSAYAGLKYGEAIEGQEGFYFGVNAFANADDAVNALTDNNSTIALFSDASMTMTVDPSFKLNIISGDGEKHTLQVDSVIDVDAEFAKEITLDAPLFMAYYNNHNVVVNGDLKGGIYNYDGSMTLNNSKITDSYDNSNIGGTVTINGDGSWTLENAQADNLKFINIGRSDWLGQGILNLNDTVVKAISYSVDSNSADAKSQINAVNSTIGTVKNDGSRGDLTLTANGVVNLTNSNLDIVGTLTNNGAVNVKAGVSTLNIANMTGDGDFDLYEGAIIQDSTVVGDASVVGKVTFRGDNTFNNLYDFGTYYASSYDGANAEIVVEEGASLKLTHKIGNAYGLGYGDKLTVNGSLTDARKVDRSTLTDEDASFYAEKGIRLSTSSGNDAADGSFFTVNNAYVIVGKSGSFSNSKTAGKFTLAFNNSVVDAANIYFSESSDVISMSFDNCDILTAIFMTEDKDSSYSLNASKLVVTGSGNDRYNGNGGTLTVTDSEITIEQGAYTNKGTLTLTNSTLSAASVVNSGSLTVSAAGSLVSANTLTGDGAIIIDAAGFTGGTKTVIDLNGTESLAGKVTLENAGDFNLAYGADGDVIITDQKTDVIYVGAVNAAGVKSENTSADANTAIQGYNKFDTITEANAAGKLVDGTTVNYGNTERVYTGNGMGYVPATNTSISAVGTVTITGGAGAYVPYIEAASRGTVVKFSDADLTLTKLRDNGSSGVGGAKFIIENSKLDGGNTVDNLTWVTFYKDSEIQITNSVIGLADEGDFSIGDIKVGNAAADDVAVDAEGNKQYLAWGDYGKLALKAGGKFTATDSTIFAGYIFETCDNGSITLNNSVLYASAILVNTVDGGSAMIKFDGSAVRQSGWGNATEFYGISIGNGTTGKAQMILTNGATLDWTYADSNGKVTDAYKTKTTESIVVNADGELVVEENSGLTAASIKNQGLLKVSDSTFAVEKFVHNSDTAATFDNVELDITELDTGSGAYVIVGGTSKVNIDNVYGSNALRLGKDAVITDGSNISGSVSARAMGNLTIGEKSTDVVNIHRLDTRYIDGDTVTVNGTLNMDGYCLGMVGKLNDEVLTLTGAGTINLKQNVFFEGYLDSNGYYVAGNLSNIVVDKDITINMVENDSQSHLRFTYANVTVNGKIINAGKAIDRTLLTSATVTVSGEGATLDLAEYLWIGYDDVYDSRTDEGKADYKSTLNVKDGGTVKVGGELRVNTESAINVEKSTLTAGTVYNSGSVTVYNDSTFTVNGAFNGADGVVNINIAEGSYGMWKVIDAEDNADSDYGKVNVNIGGTWVDEAGDLWAYNTTFDTIYVNAEWDGETNINLGDGKVLGVNAFASLDDIAENATDETTAVVITGGTYSSVSGEWVSLLAGGINSVTADGTVTLEKYGNLFFKAGAAGTYTISGDYVTTGVEGFLWEGGQNLGWKVNGVTRFEGADGVVFNITNATFTSSSAIQFIDAKAVIDANSSLAGAETTEGKLAVYGSEVVSYGKIALVTSGNPGTALLIGNAQYAEKGSSLTVSGEKASVDIAINGNQPDQVDANIHASGALTVEAGASFTAAGKVINAGTVKVNKASYFNAGTLDNSGYMDVTSSKLTAETVVNTGDVKVNGSSILVKELDNAEGTLDVTGNSSLEIGKLTGEINANDATLNGSIIGGTLNVTGASDINLGKGLNKIVFGSIESSVDATWDVTGLDSVDFAAQNGTVDITGQMDKAGFGLAQMKVGGFYKTGHESDVPEEGEDLMGSTTVNIDNDSYVKAHQVYIADNESANEHTLNVYGELEATSIFNKAMGNLNIYGDVSAEYLQAAGNVTVSGKDVNVVLNANSTSNNGATKIGTDVEGLRSQFVIEEGATVDATGTVYVGYSDTRNGDLLVNGAVLNADTIKVQEGSTFAVAGDSTVTAKVYGDMALKNGAVLNGNVSIDVDGSMIVDGKAALGAETAFSGVINGGELAVSGDKNALAINGGDAKLIVDESTVFDSNDKLGDILLKGAAKDTVLTVADAALNGNTIENLKLNITDADNQINVNTDLANIYMVNDFAVKETMGIYYYEHADGKYMYLVKEDNMINITAGVVGDDDETSTEEFDKVVIDSKNASTALAGVNLVMGDGKTSFTVKNGSKSEDIVFAIGGIHKSELGGSTTVKIGNYTDVTVNGDVENISQFTTGKDGKLTIAGDVLGQNTNNTVSFGANNDVEIKGGVNLFGGKNKIAVGANSTVDVTGSLLGVADLNIAKEAMVKVVGMYEAAAMNNKITLTNKANLDLGGIDNGGVDRGTGTTVKVGKESTMRVNGDANGIAGITVGNSSVADFNDIEGTEKTNKISIGNDSRFYAGNINLAGGKNSITSGKGTDVKVGNITNVTTVSVGAESSFTADDVTLANGKFTSGKNATVEVGNITNAKTVKTGAGELASFTAGIITNASSVEVGGQSDFKADALKNVNKFTVANGKAASKKAGAVLTNAVIDGNVEMTAGKDTFKVGANTSTVVDGEIAFGEGKDTLSMGKNAMLKVNAVSGMEVFNATDSSVLVATNGKDVDFDLGDATGSWNKATIIDMEGELEVGTNDGSVYANEFDYYEFNLELGKSLTFENLSEGIEIKYQYELNGVWTDMLDYKDGLTAAGDYRVFVGVSSDEFSSKNEKLNYILDAKLA